MRRRRSPGRPWATLLSLLTMAMAVSLSVAACTSPSPQPEPTPTIRSSTTATGRPTPEPLPWGPTPDEVEAAIETASTMTPGEVAGQVILARYDGTDPHTPADLLQQYHLAGVVLFGENVKSLDQVVATGKAVQKAQSSIDRSWPAIVATDNEGGAVQRLSAESGPWTSFPAFMSAGAADDTQVGHDAAYAMAIELRASGLNLNFAPVADVTVGAADAAIGTRSAGSDPQGVAAAVTAAVDGYSDAGILSSLKHFPGHGSLTVDSHQGLPVQDADAATLADRDLIPFQAGVDAGAPMVMMGHIAVQAWDPDVPASMSPVAYQKLREQIGFTGVAVTDGLDMGAITEAYEPGQIAVQALTAGADLLLTPPDVQAAHRGIVAALADGSLSRQRVNEAAGRVIAMMRWQAQAAEAAGPVEPSEASSGAAESLALSRAAITQVTGECGEALVGSRIHVHGGSTQDWDMFVAAAEEAGLQVVPLEKSADSDVRLITKGGRTGKADVAIALDGPWLLERTTAPVKLAVYGHSAGAFEAVADVLTGAEPAPGHVPVNLDGLPASSC